MEKLPHRNTLPARYQNPGVHHRTIMHYKPGYVINAPLRKFITANNLAIDKISEVPIV